MTRKSKSKSKSSSVCPPSAATPREPCVCLSAVPGSGAGWGAGWPAVQGYPAPSPPSDVVGESSWGVFFSALGEVFCSLLSWSEGIGKEEAWQLGRREALGAPGPISP